MTLEFWYMLPGLITEVFGFASGVSAYVRRKLIDYSLARSLMMQRTLEKALGVLFILVAVLLLGKVAL